MQESKQEVKKVVSLVQNEVPLTLYILSNFACFFAVCFFFLNQLFQKKKKKKKAFSNTIRVSNRSDPDQARRFVGPDLGPNC